MNNLNIREIIDMESVTTHFQPIISLKEKRIVGIEALSRGIHPVDGSLIPPVWLFDTAKEKNVLMDLDRLCRRLALRNYSKLDGFEKFVVFINLNTSVLNHEEKLQILTKTFADCSGVKYGNIAIEIVESELENNARLIEVIEKYREIGFFVALDDFGALHSNLNRLVITKPDIIKIDRCLIHNINKSYYQRSIIKSIIELAKSIGSLTLAEGLENEEDIFTCYEMGIDLYQGFYFARPSVFDDAAQDECIKKILDCTSRIKNNIAHTISTNKKKHEENVSVIRYVKNKIKKESINSIFSKFQEVADKHPSVQCIYLLNAEGVQIGSTISGQGKEALKQNHFFRPAEETDDHSLKDYFYYISQLGLDKFYTNPYISLASGQLCRTASFRTAIDGKNYIICIDFLECHTEV